MTERNYDIVGAETDAHPIKAWVRGVPFEEQAKQQLRNIANLPFIHRHVAAMPDVHLGKGATVGSVIATVGAVIPAAVGVDLGCGVQAVQTNITANDLPDNLHALRTAIEAAVPHGRSDNGGKNDVGGWRGQIPDSVSQAWTTGRRERHHHHQSLYERYMEVVARSGQEIEHNATLGQLGTLGTGNHFIEICLDEQNRVWVMLHSGSRGPGNRIGSHFTEIAKREMERYFIHLPDADLAYLPEGTEHFDDYVDAVSWAQDYAKANREIMMRNVILAIETELGRPITLAQEVIDCHHNYISRENHFGKNVIVTRKGAVRAREGDIALIPGSMGTKSYIARGKGNPESFHSCSHGAGRRMSRGEAKRTFTVEDHAKATASVECRKDAEVVDETPMAYKSIDAVMAAQADLVEIVHTLKQILCVKG